LLRPSPDRAEGDLDTIEPPPPIDDLEARIERNPDLARTLLVIPALYRWFAPEVEHESLRAGAPHSRIERS
jgi:hypothetical protein